MMEWVKTAHCRWECGEFQILKKYCPVKGGTVFTMFDGRKAFDFATLESAMKAAEAIHHV